MKRKNTGRNELARQAHFRKAGPTEKVDDDRIKEQRQQDKLDERQALREHGRPESSDGEPV